MKHKALINEVYSVFVKHNPTPKDFRYVMKQVKQRGKWYIKKEGRKFPTFLIPSEFYHLLSIADNMQKDYVSAMLVRLLLFSGLRINEATNLMVHQIDFYSDEIKVINGKGGVDRTVPLAPSLKTSLNQYLQGRSNGHVFRKKNEKPYTTRALQYKVDKIIKLCYFNKNVSSHTLRHTFATILRAKGMKIQDIQMFMGHKFISTTEIYAHMTLTQDIKNEFIKMLGM